MTIDGFVLPGLPVLVAALLGALMLLALAIAALRRTAHGVELARLPLAASQDVRLDVAGPVVLQGEGPHFTRRFAGLTFRLLDRVTGQVVPARRVWVRTSTASVARVRLALARFDLPRAGVFRLEVAGLTVQPTGDAGADCALIFGPPAGLRLPLTIATCVLAGGAVVAVLVGIGLTTFGVDQVPVSAIATDPADHSPPAGAARAVAPSPTFAAPAVAGSPGLASGAIAPAAHAGRQLRADPAPTGPTRTVHWTGAGVTLTIPATWQTRADGPELDVRDPARPSTYLVGHVVTFPPPTTAAVLVRAVTESAAGRVDSGLLAGFTAGRWGGVDGLVTIETRGDGAATMAVWSAYRPTSQGVANVTLLFGADAETFARLEPAALAVLASVRFD